MARYSLFYSLRSPFARRVRVAMARLNIPFDAQEINVFEPTPELREANPLGLVPVLSVKDPKEPFFLPDSSTILEYLHENYGNRIWPADLQARARVRAASTLAEGLMAHSVTVFLERQRPAASTEVEMEYLGYLNATLARIAETSVFKMPWKVSDLQLTQAGYDLMIALDYLDLRNPELEWRKKWPELHRFHETHRSRSDLVPTAPPPAQ